MAPSVAPYRALATAACAAPTALQEELPCWREWLSVAYEGLGSALTMGATVALIESCGITLGTTCVAAAWGIAGSAEEFDDFVGALDRLRTCLNGGDWESLSAPITISVN